MKIIINLIIIFKLLFSQILFADENFIKGKEIFINAGNCATCHSLKDAGSNAMIGPNLNEIRPDIERVKNVVIKNSTIGPGTSIGEGTEVNNCSLKNCLIQNNSYLKDLTLNKAMIGNYVHYKGNHKFVSIGDYSKLK